MALIETLTTTVGYSIAKSIFKIWTKDDAIFQEISLDLSGLIGSKISNYRNKRSINSQFERIPDRVAVKMEKIFEIEFRDVDRGDIDCAILDVSEAINKTTYDLDFVISSNFDPISLENLYKSNVKRKENFYSEGYVAVFDRVLRESCNYIVEISVTLPDFHRKTFSEILKREDDLIELVTTVLAKIPDGQALREGVFGSDLEFERQYRRSVAIKLDWLELYGVDLDPVNKRYALSVGYISLSASKHSSVGSVNAGGARNEDVKVGGVFECDATLDNADEDDGYVSVEQALSTAQKILLRGEAGSGKTTLLQWLAVRSAKQDFTGVLDQWNGLLPFFLQLRRYVGCELPRPEEFVDQVGSNVVGLMPGGWVHRQLERGNALVLIDGVDELPDGQRAKAKKWLLEMVQTFPNAKFVVTSRPPAVSDTWLDSLDFVNSELQSMSMVDIERFVDHWHEAAFGVAVKEPDDQNDKEILKKKLKAVLRENRAIRNLSTSPLLCAMLCALNRDRRAQLPQDRMALYHVALEMLLERRDAAREISYEGGETLTLEEKTLIMQNFAYWLLINGYSDSPVDKAIKLIEDKILSMPRVKSSGAEVYKYLLLRSGLIREPISGRVDFIHRTFLEFLAAKEIISSSSVGMLIDNAHKDQWREVVVLACGHARADERRDLIDGILDRGDIESLNRHKLHLLALTCLETSPELSPDVEDRLYSCLSELVPPATMSEARDLASAGDMAVDAISKLPRLKVREQAACVRTLALVGSDKSLSEIKKIREDFRITVIRELIRAWSYFDTELYAREVLSKSYLNYGSISLETPSFLVGVQYLQRLRRLSFDFSFKEIDFSLVSKNNNINWLDMSLYECSLKGLSSLNGIDDLKSVKLSLSGVCDIDGEDDFINIDFLDNLSLTYTSFSSDFLKFSNIYNLSCLELRYNPNITDLSFIQDIEYLREFEYDDLVYDVILPDFRSMGGLKKLDISVPKSFKELNDCGVFSLMVEDLKVDVLGLPDFKCFLDMSDVKFLSISLRNDGCNVCYDLSELLELKELYYLRIDSDPTCSFVGVEEVEEKIPVFLLGKSLGRY